MCGTDNDQAPKGAVVAKRKYRCVACERCYDSFERADRCKCRKVIELKECPKCGSVWERMSECCGVELE